MGAASKKSENKVYCFPTLEIDRTEESEEVQVGKIFTNKRPASTSGIRRKVFPLPLSDEVLKRKIKPKRFLVAIHYHYPLVNFPPALKNEIEQMEDFFGLQKGQRGEGTFIYGGRLLATMTYRVNLKPESTRGFRKALCDVLDRYGAEIINYQISRT
jgi:hypothetical protein